tara:strand:- start:439 stop:1119 length:681 start_codon:yes stop_codon:yes gene_type:complete
MKISSIIENAYRLPNSFSCLECGACAMHELETKSWSNDKNVWYLEPNVHQYNLIKNEGYSILNLALSDSNKLKKFCVSNMIGWSFLETSEVIELNDHIRYIQPIQTKYNIECITYEKLQQTLNIKFDILILDIEGHEDAVLENMASLQKQNLPKIFCIECGYDWETRKRLVKNLGYDLDFYYFNNAYFSMDSPYPKNLDVINEYNKQWAEWTYNGIKIYENENTNL